MNLEKVEKKVVEKQETSEELSEKDFISKVTLAANNAYGEDNVECRVIGTKLITTIRFPEITIQNGKLGSENKTTIYNLLVRFKINLSNFRLMSDLEGMVLSASWYNLLSGYVHSHLKKASNISNHNWGWQKFCTGSGPINNIVYRSSKESDKTKRLSHVLAYLFHLREFVSWQSDEGIPYYYLNKRKNYLYSEDSNNNLLSTDRYHTREIHQALIFLIMEELLTFFNLVFKLKTASKTFNMHAYSSDITDEVLMELAIKIKPKVKKEFHFGLIAYKKANSNSYYSVNEECSKKVLTAKANKLCLEIGSYTFKGKKIDFTCVDIKDIKEKNIASSDSKIEIINYYMVREAIKYFNSIEDFYDKNSIKF